MKAGKLTAGFCLTVLLTAAAAVTSMAAPGTSGDWRQEQDGRWYYYDEEGYLRAACFMKNGSSYVRKIFHRLNHARESIALVVKKNEKVYNTLLELL